MKIPTGILQLNGGVGAMKMTTLRDPAYYNLLVRFIGVFQRLKANLPVYMKKDVSSGLGFEQ